MSVHHLHRAWPALGVIALFALSAAAPAPVRTGPAPPPQAAATCDPFSQTGAGDSVYTLGWGSGLHQPLPEGTPVSACSLRANGVGWTYAEVRMVEWDPLALAPDPQTIALRTAYCDPSRMNFYTLNSLPKLTFVPPIVSRSLPGVADPPRPQVACEVGEYSNVYAFSLVGYYAPEGDPAMPAATTFGSTAALSGAHPVAAYALCDGGAPLAELRVVQSVRRTDTVTPAGLDEYLQRFRVPEAVEVRWVELALQYVDPRWNGVVEVNIVEATAATDPPQAPPAALAQALLVADFSQQPGPRWAATVDFDHTVELLPGRDYWLFLRNLQAVGYRTHTLTDPEDAKFTDAIGAFHHRASSTDPWTLTSGQALSFKLVGRSLGSPVSVVPRTGFVLNVTPNPAGAAAEVAWSGATGPVKLEVFDARGRRVAAGNGGAAGRWVIGGQGARTLGSGVYFVHAQDSEGARADQRLVIVR